MPESLPIPSFEVEGFRAIHRLELRSLKRVNLFVGENNAGKTSLLEAMRLYMHRNARTLSAVVVEIVTAHTDFRSFGLFLGENEPLPGDLLGAIDAVEGLFYGSFNASQYSPIRLAAGQNDPTALLIRSSWSADSSPSENGAGRPALVDINEAVLHLQSERSAYDIPLEWFIRRVPLRSTDQHLAVVIPSSGLDAFDTRVMWDDLLVSGEEAIVEDAVRVIVPDLERVVVVGEQRSRSVMCKLRGVRKPIPILSMGDGAARVFGLAVALTQARGGALLVDEIENGLHYSIQSQVWNAIFSLASTLDVQVFATTHSWDTVVAFQEAANRSVEEGILYRLDREDDGWIHPVRYSEEEVAIAADQQIEVR